MAVEPYEIEKKSKEYYIKKNQKSPKIDGVLDVLEWSGIIPITDFLQKDPDNLKLPTEKTEVFLTYDNESIYIGAHLYDRNPRGIKTQLAPRDDWFLAFDEVADWFSISIDSRHDHQTGYSFAVNASGVLSDEMIYHDQEYDNDWDAIWQAEVSIVDDGWVVEIEIPFSNFPFYKSDSLVWGLNINRFLQRKSEYISWVVLPVGLEGIVSQYGHLKGLKEIYPPAKFEFKPYSMASNTQYTDIRLLDYENPLSHNLNFKDDPKYNLGLDLQYRISNNSNLTFTFNPDFGQVESDPADINLTAYETYFKDKRPFFIKDIDIFETPIEIFYSRRIGEKAWGAGASTYIDTLRSNISTADCLSLGGSLVEDACIDTAILYYDMPVSIKAAGKFTGKTESGFSYGLLGAVTDLENDLYEIADSRGNRNYFVSRFKQDFFSSSIGLMTTSSTYDSSHVFSVDGKTTLLSEKMDIETQIIITNDQKNSLYTSINYSPIWFLESWFDYGKYDSGIQLNSLGYLYRDDYVENKIGINLYFEDWKIIRDGSLMIEYLNEKNINGLNLGNSIDFTNNIKFDNSWVLESNFRKIYKHYDDRKIILDTLGLFGPPIIIPEVNAYSLSFSSPRYLNIWCFASFTLANNTRSDIEKSQYWEINYKPSANINFGISYDQYALKRKFHWLESFSENDGYHHIFSDLDRQIKAFQFRSTWNLNKKLSLELYTEIFNNNDLFDSNSYQEYDVASEKLIKTDYINGEGNWSGMPVYTLDVLNLSSSYLDPNLYNGLYTKYTSLVVNSRLKWNYAKGSYIYMIFSSNKTVNGYPYYGIDGFIEFVKFNEKKSWVETIRDKTILIKFDYWFEI